MDVWRSCDWRWPAPHSAMGHSHVACECVSECAATGEQMLEALTGELNAATCWWLAVSALVSTNHVSSHKHMGRRRQSTTKYGTRALSDTRARPAHKSDTCAPLIIAMNHRTSHTPLACTARITSGATN